MAKKITKKEVNRLAGEYQSAVSQWGMSNMVTERAFVRYMEAKRAYEASTGKSAFPII